MLLPMQMEFSSGREKGKTSSQYNIMKICANCFSDDFAYYVEHKNMNCIHCMAHLLTFISETETQCEVYGNSDFFFESKLENILFNSENDSNISPLLAISCQFVSTFGIKIIKTGKVIPMLSLWEITFFESKLENNLFRFGKKIFFQFRT